MSSAWEIRIAMIAMLVIGFVLGAVVQQENGFMLQFPVTTAHHPKHCGIPGSGWTSPVPHVRSFQNYRSWLEDYRGIHFNQACP